jgi:hypothetical protein
MTYRSRYFKFWRRYHYHLLTTFLFLLDNSNKTSLVTEHLILCWNFNIFTRILYLFFGSQFEQDVTFQKLKNRGWEFLGHLAFASWIILALELTLDLFEGRFWNHCVKSAKLVPEKSARTILSFWVKQG